MRLAGRRLHRADEPSADRAIPERRRAGDFLLARAPDALGDGLKVQPAHHDQVERHCAIDQRPGSGRQLKARVKDAGEPLGSAQVRFELSGNFLVRHGFLK